MTQNRKCCCQFSKARCPLVGWRKGTAMGQLDSKVVLLSGGASGIGRATALLLAEEGASVAIGDVAVEAAEAIATEITGSGGRALAGSCDVRREESVAAFVEHASAAFGGIDCVDHNAAW